MRIRKRSVPLPLSSLCPVTLPHPQLYKLPTEPRWEQDNKGGRDAAAKGEEKQEKGLHPDADRDLSVEPENTHLNRPQISQNQTPASAKLEDNQPCSDPQLMIIGVKKGWIYSDGCERGEQETKKECCMCPNTPTQVDEDLQGEEMKGKRWRVKSNNFSQRSRSVVEDAYEFGLFSSSSSQVGRWREGEKAFPLKKRRGGFERKVSEETIMEKEKKMRTILKAQMNKKWVQEEDEEEKEERGKEETDSYNNVKKRRIGGAVMEGSRCSRVNGRGWRCCQQTLVGYSLCEHHLGKGRLRSMSSVRRRASAIAGPKKEEEGERRLRSLSLSWSASLSSSLQEKQQEQTLLDEGGEEDEEKPLMITKKRKKIGMVKARSISSLLGQTNNALGTSYSSSNGIF